MWPTINQSISTQSDNVPVVSEPVSFQEGTTEFIATNAIAEVRAPLSIPNSIKDSYFPNDVTSVIHYLSKPIPVASGAWSTGSTAGTLLFNQDSWVGIWNNVMYREKLHGFYGLRATLKVDIVLNANPFQAGRLRLCYYPAGSLNQLKMNMHITHRVPISQLPGIDIGCGDESVSLSIPYVTPSRFIELTSGIISWGYIFLAVMSPLNVGTGDTTADYTIWYSLRDIELFGQTNRAVSQQSAVGKGKARRINPSENEIKPISHVLGAASDFASAVGQIPLLSPWAGPVSWFLNAAKGAAISFGFSKPISTKKPCMMSSNYNWHVTTADGVDNSIPLAMLYDAKLRLLDDVNPGGEDQMSIDFIKRQWSFISTFSITEVQAQGASIYTLLLQPDDLRVNPGTDEYYYSSVAYLSRLFTLYRGGLEVMLKFVKTGFHAASLSVSFVPGPNDASLTLTDTSFVYRTIIDLQEGDEACFNVPYLLPLDFIDTGIPFGRLYVNVVNPLRSPETCSQTVDVLVYVRGSESFQVQNPAYWPALPITQQGGEVTEISETIVCSAPGEAPIAPRNDEFCQDSMSETVCSTLQLLKRFNSFSVEWGIVGTENNLVLCPWVISLARRFGGVYTSPPGLYDPVFSQVTAPFAFYRGGMRYRATGTYSGGDDDYFMMYRGSNSVGGLWINSTTKPSTWPMSNAYSLAVVPAQSLPVAVNTTNSGGLSVSVPYQSVYRMAPIEYQKLDADVKPFHVPRPLLNIDCSANRSRLFSRAAGDDFQCLFWVGIPRLSL